MKALPYTPPHLRPKKPRPQTKAQQFAAEKREIEKHMLPELNSSLISRILKNGRVAIALGKNREECGWLVINPDQAKQWAANLYRSLGGDPK